jgi:hypothetical protein
MIFLFDKVIISGYGEQINNGNIKKEKYNIKISVIQLYLPVFHKAMHALTAQNHFQKANPNNHNVVFNTYQMTSQATNGKFS